MFISILIFYLKRDTYLGPYLKIYLSSHSLEIIYKCFKINHPFPSRKDQSATHWHYSVWTPSPGKQGLLDMSLQSTLPGLSSFSTLLFLFTYSTFLFSICYQPAVVFNWFEIQKQKQVPSYNPHGSSALQNDNNRGPGSPAAACQRTFQENQSFPGPLWCL